MTIVTRPTLEIVSSPSGKSFTYRAGNPSWNREYQRRDSFESAALAKEAASSFAKAFEILASGIENGTVPKHHIMGAYVENGYFRSRVILDAKLTTGI